MKRISMLFVALILGLSLPLIDSTPIEAKPKRDRAWLGVDIQTLTKGLAAEMDIPVTHGALITDVERKSPAREAGLKDEDVVLKVDDDIVDDAADLRHYIRSHQPGDKLTLRIMRDGKEQDVVVTLDEAPEPAWSGNWFEGNDFAMMPPVAPVPPVPQAHAGHHNVFAFHGGDHGIVGMSVVEVTDGLAEFLSMDKGEGLFVVDVERESAASQAGMKPGDVVIKAGKYKVFESEDLWEAVGTVDEDESLELTVVRKGKEMTVTLTPEKGERLGTQGMMWFDDDNSSWNMFRGKAWALDNAHLGQLRELAKLREIRGATGAQKEAVEALREELEDLRKELEELRAKGR